jgi:hypothetical protein
VIDILTLQEKKQTNSGRFMQEDHICSSNDKEAGKLLGKRWDHSLN